MRCLLACSGFPCPVPVLARMRVCHSAIENRLVREPGSLEASLETSLDFLSSFCCCMVGGIIILSSSHAHCTTCTTGGSTQQSRTKPLLHSCAVEACYVYRYVYLLPCPHPFPLHPSEKLANYLPLSRNHNRYVDDLDNAVLSAEALMPLIQCKITIYCLV